jgi:hypothetical protein
VRVKITRQYSSNIVKTLDFAVQNISPAEPEINNSIKMEVGIEDCLHIEFEYNKSKYAAARRLLLSRLLCSSLGSLRPREQIPLARRGHRQNLLFAGAHQNQAHGDRHHQARIDRLGPQHLQRERKHLKV